MIISLWKSLGGTWPELDGYNLDILASRDESVVRVHVTSTKMAGGLASAFVDEHVPILGVDPTDAEVEARERIIHAAAIAARDALIANGGAFAAWRWSR